MRARLVVCALLAVASVRGQGDILTEDVTRFWEAFDALAGAKDHADSVGIIECRGIAATILSCDAALKAAEVSLISLRVRKRLGNDIIRTRRGFGYTIGGGED